MRTLPVGGQPELIFPKTKRTIKPKEPWNNDWIHSENKERPRIIKSKNGNDEPIYSKPNTDIRSRVIRSKNLKL